MLIADLTKEHHIEATTVFFFMIHLIEVRDKYNGSLDSSGVTEIVAQMPDIGTCPRQTFKFFHRRNSCNCLGKIYYRLKETTKRRSRCHYCEELVDIKEMSRCQDCKAVQYCSYGCAVGDRPRHKEEECKILSQHRKPEERVETFDIVEEVD